MDLSYLRATRANHLSLLRGLTAAQLNHIPAPHRNNLIWNAGHVIATQELLTYGLAGVKTPSGKVFIDRYRKGTVPEGEASQEEIDLILDRLTTGVDRLEEDLSALDFSNFREYPTSYGITLRSVEEGLRFNHLHEAMHLGTMIALRKYV